MNELDGYIGVFDSGVGGISVLKALTTELGHEQFVYFGDSAHAPYGDKTPQEIREFSDRIVQAMIQNGVKAIVIACNTATSVAAEHLRARYPGIPIVGVEPAVKPAAESDCHENILVMATPVTLRLEKFQRLVRSYGSDSQVISLACPGLADLIERGRVDDPEITAYLKDKLLPYVGKIDCIVLGCTHYPFVKHQIRKIVGSEIPLFDGGRGTARHLRHVLEEYNLLAQDSQQGKVVFRSSSTDPDTIATFEKMFALSIV